MGCEVFEKDGKIYRHVKDIELTEKIINIFNKHGVFSNQIVETKITDKNENLIEHKYLYPILNSGEYTTSMALDVIKHSIDMTSQFIDLGIYSFDSHPHQYTYTNGKWIMYDFESFELTPIHTKAQIRGTFKISFSSLELLKIIDRSKLKHYFLNRINHKYLSKMISTKSFLSWSLNLTACLFINNLKLYKLAITLLNKCFEQYNKKYERKIYTYKLTENDKKINNLIDKIITDEKIEKVFAIGEKSAQWAINSNNSSFKFIYLDKYDICDEFYNLIYLNKFPNISTAVIYPLAQDNQIPQDYAYRGLYDYLAKDRFRANSVIILNNDELYTNKKLDIEDFVKNIMEFSTHLYIHKFDKSKETELANNFKIKIEKYYTDIQQIETDNDIIIIAKNKKFPQKDFSNLKQYDNFNRTPLAEEQNTEIIKIIKNN